MNNPYPTAAELRRESAAHIIAERRVAADMQHIAPFRDALRALIPLAEVCRDNCAMPCPIPGFDWRDAVNALMELRPGEDASERMFDDAYDDAVADMRAGVE